MMDSRNPRPKPNILRRWMAWSGSFLVLSILVHALLLGGATVLVVQVVQGRKEKLKFTAPPPSAPSVEHSVKPAKKASAPLPSVSKRIMSTAAGAQIALPPMELDSPQGQDVMASVMSGLGGGGLGAGAGGAAGGMAAMPVAGMTAFGFKGSGQSGGLTGRLYDLKQTKDRGETNIKDDGFWKNPHQVDGMDYSQKQAFTSRVMADPVRRQELLSPSLLNEAKVINSFLGGGWDEKILLGYYRSQDPMVAYQWSIPMSSPKDAVKAFGVENEVKPTHIMIHYKGFVVAPRDMTLRFRCMLRGGVMAVRFNNENVLLATFSTGALVDAKPFDFVNEYPEYDKGKGRGYHGHALGKWFKVQAGERYPVEIFITMGEGDFGSGLMIEEKDPPKPYELSAWQWQSNQGRQYQSGETLKEPFVLLRYPLFALRKGVPAVPFTMPGTNAPAANDPTLEGWKREGWHYKNPDVAAEPMIFPGAK